MAPYFCAELLNMIKLSMFMIDRTYPLIVLLASTIYFSTTAHSANRNSNYIESSIDFQLNDITNLKLPTKALKGSLISTQDSFIINFKEKGSISVHTITSESIGFSVDMRNYPAQIMGLNETNENNEYAVLVNTAIKDSIITYQPIKTATFKTRNGDGYLTIGSRGAVIYLTDSQNDQQVTKIHIENMSEKDINNLIIMGLL